MVTQESEVGLKTIDLTIKAEGIVASAFYLIKTLKRSAIARSKATKPSHNFKVKIATLPLVARHDNIKAFIRNRT